LCKRLLKQISRTIEGRKGTDMNGTIIEASMENSAHNNDVMIKY